MSAAASLTLDSPVTDLKGVGEAAAKALAGLRIQHVGDLLFHLPLRFEDRTRITPVRDLRDGQRALILVQVKAAQLRYGGRRSLLLSATDGGAWIGLRLFHFSKAQQQGLQPGQWLRCYGEARLGKGGMEMVHPEYRRVADQASGGEVEDRLSPVYPLVTGLQQARLKGWIAEALALVSTAPELLPTGLAGDWPTLHEALMTLHRPPPEVNQTDLLNGLHPAQRRLAFEELVAQHLSLRALRQRVQSDAAPVCDAGDALRARLLAALPFAPTGAQQRVSDQIIRDLAQPRPMLRLVQGDVGSGKTLVAALAAVTAIGSGQQVAMMAPTELLAEQHAGNLAAWLEPLGISIALLTGTLKGAQRRTVEQAVAAGDAQLVVGTHALFQQSVSFRRLGLIIIDEQHRFGVHQRLALSDKGGGLRPHQLVMTATPIPRTLAMSLYADMDTSVIDEMPPGRTPVTTVALPIERRGEVLQRVASACEAGRQAYWVCTLVEESELLQCQAAEQTAEMLERELAPLKVGLVHGRMKSADKETRMQAFKAGDIQLLVATTVIEVGVDVPNASLMIIENAERLGLSQLHQLRGRVGRGSAESHCVLVYQGPLSEPGEYRLRTLRESNDGFLIAQRDLELRGPGEVLGTRQTGLARMRIADLLRDADLIPAVREAADTLLEQHPHSVAPLLKRWLGEDVDRYADV